MKHEELSSAVIACAFRVHRELGAGFLEIVYQKALAAELECQGIRFEMEPPLTVWYRGRAVGRFLPDLLIEDRLIVEIKAVQSIVAAHEVQLVNYLAASRFEIGLLLNFGAPSLTIKRKVHTFAPSASPASHRIQPV